MMVGSILKRLKSFRIVHVLSKDSLTAEKGSTYKKGLYMINEILSGHLSLFVHSIELVLNKWSSS